MGETGEVEKFLGIGILLCFGKLVEVLKKTMDLWGSDDCGGWLDHSEILMVFRWLTMALSRGE